jgi:poly(3-hydroxybutyrate) depolymerase/Arc/MetJ-type ribon-helix-helix transcriptional regulator
MSETEKITINLGPVDLGQIDLLVREGFYSNRTDFIRTAIRNQLATHAEAVRQTVARQTLVLGVQHFTRRGLEAVRDAGERLRIEVLGLASIADDVYPEQSAKANGQRCWNWFKADDQRRERGEPSIIAGITRQVAATQHVDTRRIYVAGMSAGGAMAVVMGATYPDLYAAVGVHSGLAYGAAHDMPSAFIAMKQGAPDPAQGKTQAAHEAEAVDLSRGTDYRLPRASRRDRKPAQRGAGAPPVGRGLRAGDGAPGPGIGRARVHPLRLPRRGRAAAERWIVHGAGHAWSGGSRRGSYTDPRGPDASAEMVRFFMENSRD